MLYVGRHGTEGLRVRENRQALARALPVDGKRPLLPPEVRQPECSQLSDADARREEELHDCQISQSEECGVRGRGELAGKAPELFLGLVQEPLRFVDGQGTAPYRVGDTR